METPVKVKFHDSGSNEEASQSPAACMQKFRLYETRSVSLNLFVIIVLYVLIGDLYLICSSNAFRFLISCLCW